MKATVMTAYNQESKIAGKPAYIVIDFDIEIDPRDANNIVNVKKFLSRNQKLVWQWEELITAFDLRISAENAIESLDPKILIGKSIWCYLDVGKMLKPKNDFRRRAPAPANFPPQPEISDDEAEFDDDIPF